MNENILIVGDDKNGKTNFRKINKMEAKQSQEATDSKGSEASWKNIY